MKMFSNMDQNTKKMLFTLLKVTGVLVVVIIILMIIAGAGSSNSYSKIENIAEGAAEDYYKDHKEALPQEDGQSSKVTISELVSGNYMKPTSSYMKDANCDGYVTVTKNGEDNLYTVKLDCPNYKSKTIADAVKSQVVTSGDGVYEIDGQYYYRGKVVNNYIEIAGTKYRIVKVDSNNNIKVIDTAVDKSATAWDTRFNIEMDRAGLGINNFERSNLQETLEEKYEDSKDQLKRYVLNYDWCTAKRNSKTTKIEEVECEETTKSHFGSLTVYEYVIASIEEACKTTDSGSCRNYNYIVNDYPQSFWLLSTADDDTYTAYYTSNGEVCYGKTSNTKRTLKSFYINGDNSIVSGTGTSSDPFVIK